MTSTRVIFAGLAALTASCATEKALTEPYIEMVENEFDAQTLDIKIRNTNSSMLCLSSTDISDRFENFRFLQNKKDIRRFESSNRTEKRVRGVNILEPIYIIDTGENDFQYDTGQFSIKGGGYTVQAIFHFFNCEDYFRHNPVRWITVDKSFDLVFTPTMARDR